MGELTGRNATIPSAQQVAQDKLDSHTHEPC